MADATKTIQTAVALTGVNNRSPSDPEAVKRWPTLTSLLNPVWKDAECVRQSGYLRMRLVGGYYLVTVVCPTEQLETTVTLDTLVDLNDSIESAVCNPRCVWLPTFEATKKSRQVIVK
jgi:hypothetical protein